MDFYYRCKFHFIKQKGTSLVELLISLSVGLFIVLFVVTLFTLVRKTMLLNSAYQQIQENTIITLQLLISDIKKAGFFGCGFNNFEIKIKNIPFPLSPDFSLRVLSPSQRKDINSIIINAKPDSDVLLIEYVDNFSKGVSNQSGLQLDINNLTKYKTDNLIFLSDCQNYILEKVTGIFNDRLELDKTLNPNHHYFIAIPHEYIVYLEKKDEYSVLVIKDLLNSVHNPDEIAQGIEKMKFNIHYFLKKPLGEQNRLTEISLLSASLIQAESKPQFISFEGKIYVAPDRKTYREFKTAA